VSCAIAATGRDVPLDAAGCCSAEVQGFVDLCDWLQLHVAESSRCCWLFTHVYYRKRRVLDYYTACECCWVSLSHLP
jgi:hypothetical protein